VNYRVFSTVGVSGKELPIAAGLSHQVNSSQDLVIQWMYLEIFPNLALFYGKGLTFKTRSADCFI
jgi:hypothetical protein